MRNLDWLSNSGINKNKMVFVWKIDKEIAHTTIGFPGVWGALTGMSAAGLTVHESGIDSYKETLFGLQWTLRLRYIMGKAKNLKEAEEIWRRTNNTLSMNNMIASGNIVDRESPALVLEMMSGYTAYFLAHDKRQDQTSFIDPQTKKTYIGGFSMEQAVFRTNHAYDPIIRKHLVEQMPGQHSNSMTRYMILKDSFNWYNDTRQMSPMDALNLTAILGDKGMTLNYTVCPRDGTGGNVISVMYRPENLKMWVAFEYNTGFNFLPACCSVYVNIDMTHWFAS